MWVQLLEGAQLDAAAPFYKFDGSDRYLTVTRYD